MEEVHDEADDEMEEDDGDLDAVMKNLNALEPEKAVEPPELDMLRAADRLLEDEDFGDEEMEEDDVLSVLFADEPPKMEVSLSKLKSSREEKDEALLILLPSLSSSRTTRVLLLLSIYPKLLLHHLQLLLLLVRTSLW